MDFSVNHFFQEIFSNKHINLRCLKKDAKPFSFNGHYNQNIIHHLTQMNEQNYDIYFVVNSGGYNDKEITGVNAVFVDLDCGRDPDGKYFPLEVVAGYKQTKREEIHRFEYQPSFIVETRNGLQVYWLVNQGATTKQFIECQQRLINYFNADRKVRNLARLMRVPDYFWCKDPNQKFLARIIEQNDNRYEIQDMIRALPKIDYVDKCDNNREKYKPLLPIVDTNIHSELQNNPLYIMAKDVSRLHEALSPTPVECRSHEEVYENLKKQNLWQFLGVPDDSASFRCIFHNDQTPSAGIIINQDTGHHIYCCQSTNCSFGSGTIMKCVERLLGCDKVEALRFLRKVYKIKYMETRWQREQKEALEANMRYILSDEFEIEYPELYKRVNSYLNELYLVNSFAKDHIVTENFCTKDNRALFYLSTRHFAKLCRKIDQRRTSDRLNLFVYLGLLDKLHGEQIPEFLSKKAVLEAAKKHQKYLISYYSVPAYCDQTLTQAEQKAVEFKERKFTMRGWGREILLRAYGEEEADRVFPQVKGKAISSLNEVVSEHLERIMIDLLQSKGWFREKEVLEQTKSLGIRKLFKETELKRMLPEFLVKYALVKKKLNKELKCKLGIDESGYFDVVFPEEA